MIKIICPECGAEYLPAEIFYPKEFFGNPHSITKDRSGKIQFFSGINMNLSETYICDYCKTKLNVTTNIDFFVKSPQVKQSHVTKFKRSNLQLTEK